MFAAEPWVPAAPSVWQPEQRSLKRTAPVCVAPALAGTLILSAPHADSASAPAREQDQDEGSHAAADHTSLNDGPMPDPDPIRFRDVFGRFPTGVAVITAPGGGMTANAVCSLSLDPLLVLVCFDRSARTLPLVQGAGRFAVNVLRARATTSLAGHVRLQAAGGARSSPPSPTTTEHGVPVLDDALAWMVCDLERAASPAATTRSASARVTALDARRGRAAGLVPRRLPRRWRE